ncbi:MAG: RodZ domain-containing protein [Pseudomonadota bacterium]
MDGEAAENPTLFPASVGEKLRDARLAQNMDVSEIATRTRIPQRHLEAIERSDYSGLPSPTYATGFAKAYARIVGLDEVAIARDLRKELSVSYDRPSPTPPYEMADPMRTPPSTLVWVSVLVVLLLLAGAGIFYGTGLFRGTAPAPSDALVLPEDSAPAPAAQSSEVPSPAATGGQVTITATDKVWIRVTDASGKRLFEKEMAPGERYDVPMDADHPKLKTGRADKLQVTINGSNVAALGPAESTVEVEVSADALRARDASPAAATTSSATE